MGECEVCGGEDEVAKEEEVQVESARAHRLLLRAVTAKVALDAEERTKQEVWSDLRREFEIDDCVEKCGLVFKADGRGAVE